MTKLEEFCLKLHGGPLNDFMLSEYVKETKHWLIPFIKEVMDDAQRSEDPPGGDVVGACFLAKIKDFGLE